MIKISMWNLCRNLANKKDYVYQTLNEDKIDICLMREVEIDTNFPNELLNSKNYGLEVEKNTKK